MLTQKKKRRCEAGFTLAEVGLATAVLLMMGVMFGAAVPSILHAPQFGSNYTVAGELAQGKINQLRANGINSLTLGTVDFTSSGNLASFFPAGSTGTYTVTADPNAPAGIAYDVTVTITWLGGTYRGGSYTTRVIMAKY